MDETSWSNIQWPDTFPDTTPYLFTNKVLDSISLHAEALSYQTFHLCGTERCHVTHIMLDAKTHANIYSHGLQYESYQRSYNVID